MSLSDLAALGSFASGVAVLVSLGFLYFQIRQIGRQIAQSEKNQRALINQGAVNRSIETNIWLTQPQMSAVFIKAFRAEEMNEQDAFLLTGMVRNVLLNLQDSHGQHKIGLVDDITREHAVGSLRFFLSVPAIRATYQLNRVYYTPELLALVDGIVADLPLRPPSSLAEPLRAAIAGLRNTPDAPVASVEAT
jgi:hypothetical protein